MRKILSMIHPGLMSYVLETYAAQCPPGALIEIGCNHGGFGYGLAQIAKQQGRQCYLYDTFEGMPYAAADDIHPVGDLKADYEEVKELIPYAHVIKGVFPQSAVEMGPIAFAHIDVDQAQAHTESLEYIVPRLVVGGCIWFDDVPRIKSATRAVSEYLEKCERTLLLQADHFILVAG